MPSRCPADSPLRTTLTFRWAFVTLDACARVGSGKASKGCNPPLPFYSTLILWYSPRWLPLSPGATASPRWHRPRQQHPASHPDPKKQGTEVTNGSRWVRVPGQIRQTPQRCSAGIRGEAAAHSLRSCPATSTSHQIRSLRSSKRLQGCPHLLQVGDLLDGQADHLAEGQQSLARPALSGVARCAARCSCLASAASEVQQDGPARSASRPNLGAKTSEATEPTETGASLKMSDTF